MCVCVCVFLGVPAVRDGKKGRAFTSTQAETGAMRLGAVPSMLTARPCPRHAVAATCLVLALAVAHAQSPPAPVCVCARALERVVSVCVTLRVCVCVYVYVWLGVRGVPGGRRRECFWTFFLDKLWFALSQPSSSLLWL